MKPYMIWPMYTVGEMNYYVVTPEQDTMYFRTKREALDFIKFYKEYSLKRTTQHPHVLGMNVKSTLNKID